MIEGMLARPTVFQIIGPPAAGKFTVAKELVARLGPTGILLDNHSVANSFLQLVGQDGVKRLPDEVWPYVRRAKALLLEAAEALTPLEWSFVFTNYMIQDDSAVKSFERIVEFAQRRQALLVPVVLECSEEELTRRVGNEDRRLHSKLVDVALLQSFLERPCFVPEHPNRVILSTDGLAPSEAAEKIILHASRFSLAT